MASPHISNLATSWQIKEYHRHLLWFCLKNCVCLCRNYIYSYNLTEKLISCSKICPRWKYVPKSRYFPEAIHQLHFPEFKSLVGNSAPYWKSEAFYISAENCHLHVASAASDQSVKANSRTKIFNILLISTFYHTVQEETPLAKIEDTSKST